jgi:redox-sensitive bicupin YhaK (pirin superfamily)
MNSPTPTNDRDLVQVTQGTIASDGDGVRLTRFIGGSDLAMVDPFLLLDCFGSDQPLDYIGGFPNHPHRGFETVTYMLAGRMRHKDSTGHEDVIGPGDVQWMTAGRGLIHSEMPEQAEGLMKGTSASGTTVITNIEPGEHTITLVDDARTCTPWFSWNTDEENTVQVPVQAGTMTRTGLVCQ